MKNIILMVDSQMRLYSSHQNQNIGYDGDMNVINFTIQQPKKLNGYLCRAEIKRDNESMLYLVKNKHFTLPQAVRGHMRLQLVYTSGDGAEVSKTNSISLDVSGSVNATDTPVVADGMAIIQAAVFASAKVDSENGVMVFTNLDGREVSRVELPSSSSGTGGTSDYNKLKNLPTINGVGLSGDMNLEDIGITSLTAQEIIKIFQETED